MFNNNTSYQEAINAPSRRITGNVTIKGQKLSDDISSIDYVSSISGNTLTIGATNASTVDIKFKRLIEGLEEKELIKVSFSVQTSSGIVERQIGEFFLTEIKLDRNNKTTTLKAIDKMAFLNDKYSSTLLYPTLGRNIVQEIANSCNLRVNNNLNITSLPSFSKKLEKVTYREMLGYLAQTVGAFVIFNNNGELEFRKLNRTQKQISKGSYLLKGLEVDEVEYRINGISISLNNQEKTILAVGSPLGTQVKLTNPLMTQGWLNSIFSEYSRLRFNPFKLNWRGDPFVEVGDWVSIEIANGSYRAFPILELKLSYSGGLKSTIGANVKGTTTSTTEYKGTVERQIEFINARLGASGNYVYADTIEPTNPKEGDTWFKPNGAFTDLYIYENNQWVLKTSTGNIEGLITKITDSSVSTQNLATAIAKIIELDAARITTGSLSFEQLSSNTVSEIRKGMVSETKFNSFVNDSNGLRQQMSSEIERVVESKKSTLKGQDGTSSYIHRKYSDNSNGIPMSDNSNLKYIGIYTGDKKQAPTNASEYSWTKIRGEDGVRGRDGERGRDGNNGVSNYIHRKYSDFSNGASMSDNSNLKYIGIYTGTSPTPPTTASSYLWSKIKGEDGANGVPGAKGADGRTPYFHTAYSNSPTGDRDFSTINSNDKLYIGTYSDFEVADSTDFRKYKWVKIKGENGLNGRDGKSINENLLPNSNFNQGFAKWEDKLTNSGLNHSFDHANFHFGRGLHIYGTANDDYKGFSSVPFNLIAKQGDKLTLSVDLGKDTLTQNAPLNLGIHYIDDKDTIVAQEWQTLDLATQNFEVKKYKRISRVFTVGKDIRKCRVMIYTAARQLINFYIDNIKLERGEVATEWSPAYEDLQAHSLTANLRFEGTYINNITNNVKAYLDVFYDGQKVSSGFNAQVKYKGGNRTDWSNFWTANVRTDGGITNLEWGNREQNGTPLEAIVLVTYKGLNTVTNSRMENIPDIVEIKEITKKYKTFESTIDRFNSTIGEVKQQVLANEEKRNLILGSRMISDKDYKPIGNDIIRVVNQDYKGLPYMTLASFVFNRNIFQGVGFNLSKHIIRKDERYSIRIPIFIASMGIQLDQGAYVEIKNHSKNEILWNGRLNTADVQKDKWVEREFTFTASKDISLSDASFWIYIVRGGSINIAQPFMCEGDTLPKNYSPAPEDVYLQNSRIESSINQTKRDIELKVSEVSSNNSKLESSINQTKDQIDLKVSKDNVINAINISSEGTRIKGDLIADYLYGKTIEGATLQGNTQIKLGEHGFLQPITQGLQINAPANYKANNGVGFQIRGKFEKYSDGTYTPKGVFIYNDTNFSTGTTAYENVNDILLTVNGKVSMCNNFQGGVVSGAPIISNFTANNPVTLRTGKMYRISFIGWDGASGQLYVNDGSDTNGEWWFKPDSSSSDKRLKENIKESTDKGLDLVNKLKFYSFDWKPDKFGYKKPHTKIGQLAQDLQQLDESLVYLKGDMLAIDDFRLLNISLKAIQELSTENQQLKSQLNEMNERLQKLEDKINNLNHNLMK